MAPLFQVYGAHYGLIALIQIPLVKPNLWWCSSDHLLTSKNNHLSLPTPPILLLWPGKQEEVLIFRAVFIDAGTKFQLSMKVR